ncbi:unnamed protein product [Penicillium pancosmium]
MSRKCRQNVTKFHQNRWDRNIARRWHDDYTNYTIYTEAPYYDVIPNDTWVLTPEGISGPYVYPPSQTLRQAITENQPGVPLWLDIGIINMDICEPLSDVLVDIWHCNATGSYSSFTGLSPNIPFPQLLQELNISNYQMGLTDIHTDRSTWLRGLWPTDCHGIMEVKTVFPGFYDDRTIHIHVQVHTSWELRENGTIVTGNTISTGQIYFPEKVSAAIMAIEPYASHAQIARITSAEDPFFSMDSAGGFDPIIHVVPVDQKNVIQGMVGYITLSVDTTLIRNGSQPWESGKKLDTRLI